MTTSIECKNEIHTAMLDYNHVTALLRVLCKLAHHHCPCIKLFTASARFPSMSVRSARQRFRDLWLRRCVMLLDIMISVGMTVYMAMPGRRLNIQ